MWRRHNLQVSAHQQQPNNLASITLPTFNPPEVQVGHGNNARNAVDTKSVAANSGAAAAGVGAAGGILS
jgi:hypothetical protein